MTSLATRSIALGLALMLAASPVLAQEAPDTSTPDQSQTQTQDQDQDRDAPPTLVAADPAAVIAQWGPAPGIGPDADSALARRWFREQNTMRARWGVPTATHDPYLDWMAENRLRDRLGLPQLPQPAGVTVPAAVAQSQSDQAILSESEFWTVSDDLWQAWLDSIEGLPPAGWEDERPGEPWFTRDNYLFLFKLQKAPRFDRYRLIGVAARVDYTNSPPVDLPPGHNKQLEQLAPGAVAAYQPVVYPDNLISVVGSQPWINPDGSILP